MRHFRITTGSDSSDDTIKPAVTAVVDDPAAAVAFADGLDTMIELCFLLQSVLFPDLLYLLENFIALGVAFVPEDGRKEAVHDTVDLKAGSTVHSLRRLSIGRHTQ